MARRHAGVSRQVRRVQLVAPRNNASLSSVVSRTSIEKVSATLGFKARAEAREQLKERLRFQYAGEAASTSYPLVSLNPRAYLIALDKEGRELIQSLRTASQTSGDNPGLDNDFVMQDYTPDDEDGYEDEDGDGGDGEPETITHHLLEMMSDLRRYVVFFFSI